MANLCQAYFQNDIQKWSVEQSKSSWQDTEMSDFGTIEKNTDLNDSSLSKCMFNEKKHSQNECRKSKYWYNLTKHFKKYFFLSIVILIKLVM